MWPGAAGHPFPSTTPALHPSTPLRPAPRVPPPPPLSPFCHLPLLCGWAGRRWSWRSWVAAGALGIITSAGVGLCLYALALRFKPPPSKDAAAEPFRSQPTGPIEPFASPTRGSG